jgi:carboxylesterase type B
MEGTVFTLDDYSFPPTPPDYNSFLNFNFGASASKVNETYSLDKFNSTPYPSFYAMSTVLTDYAFKCPTYRALLKAADNNVSTWTYIRGKEPTCSWDLAIPDNLEILELLKATHTSEIPFVFGNLDRLPLPNGTCSFDAYERNLSAAVVAAWNSMAEDGTANGDNITTIDWPEFAVQNPVALNVGNTSYSIGAADYSAREFWDAINLAILTKSTSTNSTSSAGSGSASSTASVGATTSTMSSSLGVPSSAVGSVVKLFDKLEVLGSIAIAAALAL